MKTPLRPAAPGCNLRPLRAGLPIYRSDALTGLDAPTRRRIDGLGLTTLIDLRHRHETKAWPCDLASAPGISYQRVDLSGGLRAPSGELIGAATAIRSLSDFYLALLQRGHRELAETLNLILGSPGPVLFHCAAGKDRTGVVAALVLGLLGASDEEILTDYLETKERIGPLLPFLSAGLDLQKAGPGAQAFLDTEREFLEPSLRWLGDQGGVEAYVTRTLGLEPAEIDRWRRRFMAEKA